MTVNLLPHQPITRGESGSSQVAQSHGIHSFPFSGRTARRSENYLKEDISNELQ